MEYLDDLHVNYLTLGEKRSVSQIISPFSMFFRKIWLSSFKSHVISSYPSNTKMNLSLMHPCLNIKSSGVYLSSLK